MKRLPILATAVLAVVAITITSNSVAQDAPERRKCGAIDRYETQFASDKEFRARRFAARAFGASLRESGMDVTRTEPIDIPVVVHIVYNTDAQNVNESFVHSQIAALNEAFMRDPASGSVPGPFASRVAVARIRFALAVRDPDGKKTTGITRTQTTMTAFHYKGPEADGVKFADKGGHNAWPRDRYLNIWVCPMSGSILGYASFPGEKPETDGVVITSTAFGKGSASTNFNEGKTAVHEVGHYLNLFHIWGDDEETDNSCGGSDQVGDTPNQELDNAGCPLFPHSSHCNDDRTIGDMFMNYMDYTYDRCMHMFTKGQVARMNAALEMPGRLSLGSSDALKPVE